MSYVNSVTVYPSSATITKGKWYYGAYTSIASDCPECAEVEWYSDSPAIASVNKTTGDIYGVSTGTTRIYAEATDGSGEKDYITITVTLPISVTGISVCPTNLTMNVGDTVYLCETVYPANATNQMVTWCSSDDSVAEVNTYSGFVRAKKAGIVTITACTVDGGFSASCSVKVNYCGGSNYKNVTKHTMVLQYDGYYVCSKCGYRVKSPALQDREILNEEDYYKVLSCYLSVPYYSTLENKNNTFCISTSTLLSEIDDIRSQSEYASKYEYIGNDSKYKREYTDENKLIFPPLFVDYNNITSTNLWMHNGVADALVNFAFGFFVPKTYKPFFAAATSNNVYDGAVFLLSDLAEKAGYPEIGIILDLINIGTSEDDVINITDKVIYVKTFDGATTIQSKFVFSNDGSLKAQYNSYDTMMIIA